MLQNTAHLQSLVRRASYWQSLHEHCFQAVVLGEQNVIITDASLAVLHPLLPLSLRARLYHETSRGDSTGIVSRDTLRDTLELLKHGGVHFIDTEGEPRLLSCVDALWSSSVEPSELSVRGNVLHVQYAQLDHEAIPFLVGTEWAVLHVAQSELDALYPGWHGRWLVSQELGLRATDMGRYVFAPKSFAGAMVHLGNIDFDK